MKKILYLLIVLLAVQACRDDEDCPTDPCDGATKFDPMVEMGTGFFSFKGTELLPRNLWDGKYNGIRFPSDTAIVSGVYFEANEAYDSVYWKIGNEASYRKGNIISLNFAGFLGTHDIQMIGFRRADKLCFPYDNPQDTINRTLTHWPLDSCQVLGTWRGTYIEDDSEVFEIDFYLDETLGLVTDNFPHNLFNRWQYRFFPSFSEAKSMADEATWTSADYKDRSFIVHTINPIAYGDNYDSLIIRTTYAYDSLSLSEQELKPLTFKGKRIK